VFHLLDTGQAHQACGVGPPIPQEPVRRVLGGGGENGVPTDLFGRQLAEPIGIERRHGTLIAGAHFAALRDTTFMDPQVIADTALYLNSHLAAKVTGVTIPVDAGHLLIPGVNANPVRG
jgi:NAD(P)-dependent dehydrogenase (short-subunit alcohol dehydrogenase family)